MPLVNYLFVRLVEVFLCHDRGGGIGSLTRLFLGRGEVWKTAAVCHVVLAQLPVCVIVLLVLLAIV